MIVDLMKPVAIAGAGIFFMSCSAMAQKQPSVLVPPMVKVPGGEYRIGSAEFEDTLPVKPLTIAPFYVGQYEVTRREFAQFIAATEYQPPSQCYHEIGEWWFENETTGDWNNNNINTSMYEPVSCMGYDAARAYANWLSDQTGKHYRLLSEAEWEYLAVTFPHEPKPAVCEQGNIADLRGESEAQNRFHTSYVNLIGIESCDDGAGTVSLVGQYQPNRLGVYDLIGNVNEFVEDCYTTDYSAMPANGAAVTAENCEAVVLRGGAWHWPAWPEQIRDAKPKDWVGVLEGFRLALDAADVDESTDLGAALKSEIAMATAARLAEKPLPEQVKGVSLTRADDKQVLHWNGIATDDEPAGKKQYVVLANEYVGGRYKPVATVTAPAWTASATPSQAFEYVIAAKQGKRIGAYSAPVRIEVPPTAVPATIEAEHFNDMDNVLVFPFDENNRFVTGPANGRGNATITYHLATAEPANICLSISGRGMPGTAFTLIHEGREVGELTFDEGAAACFDVDSPETTVTLLTSSQGWQLDKVMVK